MKFLGSYLWQSKLSLCCFAVSCLVFAVTFALYGLPLEAVLYPTLICALLWLALGVWRLCRACWKHKRLTELAGLSSELLEDALPSVDTREDADYQEIIRLLRQEHRELRQQMTRRYEDMVDYYTTWAHQIKTPIASMRLTLENEDTAQTRKLSADLLRIEQYVEMVLVFLRLDAGSTDYVIRTCDLDGIVRSAVKKFAGEFISRKLRLEYQGVSAKVLTDEKWLSFVVEQVLSNALKYTPSGGITIALEGESTLCIRDTGIGIASEDLPRIFEKGFTGCNGRSDKRASGIGLYLCQRICRNLGHRIAVESVPDQGTTVRIDLGREKLELE